MASYLWSAWNNVNSYLLISLQKKAAEPTVEHQARISTDNTNQAKVNEIQHLKIKR